MENHHSWWENSRTKCWFSSSLCEITNVRDSIVYIYSLYIPSQVLQNGNEWDIYIWYLILCDDIWVCDGLSKHGEFQIYGHDQPSIFGVQYSMFTQNSFQLMFMLWLLVVVLTLLLLLTMLFYLCCCCSLNERQLCSRFCIMLQACSKKATCMIEWGLVI